MPHRGPVVSPKAKSALIALAAVTLAAAAVLQSPKAVHAAPAQALSQGKSATCASCHASIAHTQPLTQMGRALQDPAANPTLQQHPHLSFTNGAYKYSVDTVGERSTYTVSDENRSIKMPIRWAFGANNQTFLLERDGALYESLVSYYGSVAGLAVTTGDDTLKPATLEEAVGRRQSENDAKACFGCHTTGAIHDEKLALGGLRPGISCEHCHTGSEQHQANIVHGNHSLVPTDLGAMSSEDLSGFCGKCHRTWEMVVRSHWRGEMNVRFQPYRLANSRCFNGTDPRISCVACHDPHQDVERTAAFYDSKCLACHNGIRVEAAHAETPKICPVAKSNCTSCHMPRVTLPHSGGLLKFTDHQIRVIRPGDKYPN